MGIYDIGSYESILVLMNIIGEHDFSMLDTEVSLIKEYSLMDFRLIAFKVDAWNKDLSHRCAPAVFGNESFGAVADSIYLSLGNKEAMTKSKLFATVADNAKRANAILSDRKINTILE